MKKVILILAALVLVILISFYVWRNFFQPTVSIPETALPTLAPIGQSTELDDLQAELKAVDLGDFETDLDQLDSQADQL